MKHWRNFPMFTNWFTLTLTIGSAFSFERYVLGFEYENLPMFTDWFTLTLEVLLLLKDMFWDLNMKHWRNLPMFTDWFTLTLMEVLEY
jgi:hypothetical protein